MAQLQNELAERELIKKFRHDNTWLSELSEKPSWVAQDVIKIPRQGVAPNVLINNTVYPIVSNNRTDDFIALALNKYDTENTIVTDDELYSLPYEKISDVQVQHRETLEDKTASHALFSLAPSVATAKLLIIETTGAVDSTGRKRLQTTDLIRLYKQLSDLGVPMRGRILVLCNDHVEDLMMEDVSRVRAWGADFQAGIGSQMHVGFKLYAATYAPRYLKAGGTTWTRQGFEAVTGKPASIAIFKNNAVKATGSVKRYAVKAEDNPTYRRSEIGFRLHFVAVGIMDEGFGAVVSA